jgi:hypothetical protein
MARASYGADATPAVKPRNDVYTGLLAISLAGMLISCLLLFMDWWGYNGQPPSKPPLQELPAKKAPAAPEAPPAK